jgi:hypothetical protein
MILSATGATQGSKGFTLIKGNATIQMEKPFTNKLDVACLH